MGDVVDAVAALAPVHRRRLLQDVRAAVADSRLMVDTDARVVAARLLVSLLPDSLETLATLLRKRENALAYETHFTLFCYVDWATEVAAASDVAADILALVAEYLQNVPAETAKAAWMAGDMLGDHWEPREQAVPVLMDAVLHARFVAGRAGALYGLEQILTNLGPPDVRRAALRSLVHRVRTKDRSRHMRRSAAALLAKPFAAAPLEKVSAEPAREPYWKMLERNPLPLSDYPDVDDDAVPFPETIRIASTVCTTDCGGTDFIVEGSGAVCDFNGRPMREVTAQDYILKDPLLNTGGVGLWESAVERAFLAEASKGIPDKDYPDAKPDEAKFWAEIEVSYAVCVKSCGNAEYIVSGGTQICPCCGRTMFRTSSRDYVVDDEELRSRGYGPDWSTGCWVNTSGG
jgi:hypothetical protein